MKKIAFFLSADASVRHFKNWMDVKDVTGFIFTATQIKTNITSIKDDLVGRVYYYKLPNHEIVATFEKRSGVLHLKTKYIKTLPTLPHNITEIK